MDSIDNQGFDEQQIRQWWSLERITSDNKGLLTEIRILGDGGKTWSGYFDNVDDVIEAIKPYFHCNVYYTMNVLNEALSESEQGGVMVFRPKSTTSSKEIVGRKMVVIDIDPARVSNVNSTDEELGYAKQMANEVVRFLRNQGFSKPIVAVSSSGVHIKLACKLANTPENTDLVKKFLEAISMLFSTDKCHCDTVLFDPNRIIRLQGSYSRKGNGRSKTRPQRKSYYVQCPDEFLPNDKAYFQKVADMLPKKEQPSRFNNYSNETFDLDAFISKHGIAVRSDSQVSGGRKIILDHCPFDSSHKGKDAMLFVRSDGAICFHCFHNSCSHYTWQDVRLLFDPQAYDKKEYREFQHKRNYYNPPSKPKFEIATEDDTRGKKWLDMIDIKYMDITDVTAIPTGYHAFDKKVMGLLLGDVTVLSGGNASGKSILIGNILLNAAQRNFTSMIWSGELQDFRFMGWINQIAAGKNNVSKKEGYDNLYYTPRSIADKINRWLKGRIFLYNNKYGNKFAQIFADIKEKVKESGAQLVVLDNLMALSISDYEGTQNQQQTAFVNDIKEFAKSENVHIIVVMHPRKESNFQFLRKESIAGTADLTNLADNVLICHRIGIDFTKRAGEFLGAEKCAEYAHFSSVMELCKNRGFGVQDELFGMFYEQESRRLKNEISEHIIYGWEDTPVQNELGLGGSGLGDFVNAEFDIIDDDMSEPPF